MLKYLINLIYLWVHLRTLFQKCPIMVYLIVHLKVYLLMVHLCGYFLLWYGIYISKTYFKKFSYNKDIKMDILYQKYIQN